MTEPTNEATGALQPQQGTPQPAQTTEATEQKTSETKAFSDLYNQNKSDKEAWATEKAELQTQVDSLKSDNQKKADDNKTSDQLMSDLNTSRGENDTLKKSAESHSASMKEMISSAMEDLTPEQKEQVKFASDDPYKKMQFINSLKGMKTEAVQEPKKTSQGGTPGDDNVSGIDVDNILQAAANGNIGAYREAIKKFGKEETQRFIAEHKKAS